MMAIRLADDRGGYSASVKQPSAKKAQSVNAANKVVAQRGGYSVAPAKPKAPAKPSKPGSNTQYGGSSNFSGGGSSKTPKTPSEADYLKGDSTYQATVSALAKQLSNFTTDINAQEANYDIDFNKAVQELGYIPGVDGGANAWNWDDQLTASGRSYQQLLNDFASRGMLQSQGFADSQNDLTRSLNDQYGQLSTARQTFGSDLDRQLANYKDENTASSQAARAEAILRRAAQYGL